MRWARGYRNSLIHLKLMLGKKYWKADSRDPRFTLVSGNLRPTSQLICYRMAPGFCCLQPCQKCIAIPQSIFPVIQHTIFCLIGLLKKKKSDSNRPLNTFLSDGCISPHSERFLAHKVSSTVSDLISSQACWNCFLYSKRTFELVSAPRWPAWVCNALINGIVALGRLIY